MSWNDSRLGDRLRESLSGDEPLPRPRVTTALSYGRHRGPALRHSRLAAVAVALYREPSGEWTVPLTLRPSSLQHHGGQICLPGGRVEAGEDVATAAAREFDEELGLRPRIIQRCGELSTQFVYASDNLVHPVVMVIESPQEPWQPDPVEVEKVVPLPLSVLLDESCRTEMVKQRPVLKGDQVAGKLTFRAAAIRNEEQMIWGATALILDQLAQMLQAM